MRGAEVHYNDLATDAHQRVTSVEDDHPLGRVRVRLGNIVAGTPGVDVSTMRPRTAGILILSRHSHVSHGPPGPPAFAQASQAAGASPRLAIFLAVSASS